MPEPSWVRDRAPDTRWKRSKRCGTSCSGMPMPVSATLSTAWSRSWSTRTVMPPSKVNFMAFESRLSTTLAHRSRSTYTGSRSGAASTRRKMPEPVGGGVEHAGQLAGVLREVDRLEARLHPPGLQAGEVEQGVDQLEQPLAVAQDHLDPLALPAADRVLLVGEGVLGRSEQQRQRGAELVADVGEEVGLGLVELGQRLGAPPLELVGPGVGDARGQLSRDQVAEVAVAGVQRAVAVEREHLEAVGPGPRRRLERDHERLPRADRPEPGGQVEEQRLEVVDDRGGAGERGGRGPGLLLGVGPHVDALRGRRVLPGEAGAAGQARGAPVVVVQVDQREGQVRREMRQLVAGAGDRLGLREVGGTTRPQVPQGLHPPAGDDLLGVLLDHARAGRRSRRRRRRSGCRRRCGRSPRCSRCAPGTASATRPTSPHRW